MREKKCNNVVMMFLVVGLIGIPAIYANKKSFNDNEIKDEVIKENVSKGKRIAWVKHYGNNVFSSAEFGEAMSVDKNGNIYLLLTKSGIISESFFVKYDSNGNEKWRIKYPNDNHPLDPLFITFDDSENVYLRGKWREGDLVIKYNNKGEEKFRIKYDINSDGERAFAVDKDGNIYLTGWCWGWGNQIDYVTVKYNNKGEKEWTATYNGAFSDRDVGLAIAIDDSGNVYVTGESYIKAGKGMDVATIKYNSKGEQQWLSIYQVGGDRDDKGLAIALDKSGNVFVVGISEEHKPGEEYFIIKYNSKGEEEDVVNFKIETKEEILYRLLLDIEIINDSCDFYVGGITKSGNYFLNKYRQGKKEWERIIYCQYNLIDESDRFIEKHIFIRRDIKDNVYLGGNTEGKGTGIDFLIVKYKGGEEKWLLRSDEGELHSNDSARAIAVDEEGNVYVTGKCYDNNRRLNYGTIKYNKKGEEDWIVNYDGPAQGNDEPIAIAIDPWQNIYVTGKSKGSEDEYTTIKYNPTGVKEWIVKYREGWYKKEPIGIKVDDSGSVYVTVNSIVSGKNLFVTVKYNSRGEEEWISKYDGGEKGNVKSMTIDKKGNVYITGEKVNKEENGLDYVTVKYNSKGEEEWVATYNGPKCLDDKPIAIVVDDSGNVYVTGKSNEGEEEGGINYVTVKYNSKGEEEWIAKYDSDKKSDEPSAIAIDDSGNVYVTGKSYKNGWDYVTVKYNSKGEEKWVARYNGDGNGNDEPVGIVLDKKGNVYVTGKSDGGKSGMDYATVKYNSRGEEEWIERYNGSLNRDDCPVGIAIDKFSNVYVTGYSVEESGVVYTTIKYCDEYEVSIKRMDNENKNYKEGIKYTYNNNKGSIIFSFNLPSRMFTSLKIFDASGREISRVVSKELDKGNYRYEWNGCGKANGVYFYQLRIGSYNKSGKFVLH